MTLTVNAADCGDPRTGLTESIFVGSTTDIGNLTPGSDYLIQFRAEHQFYLSDFDFCLGTNLPPPRNDSPPAATRILPNECATPITGSTVGATQHSFNTGCSLFAVPDDDIFYQFRPSVSSVRIRLTNVAYSSEFGTHQLAVAPLRFDGSFTAFACTDENELVLQNLTPDEEILIGVYTRAQGDFVSFDICVEEILPPANDVCTGAFPIVPTADCGQPVTGSLAGATGDATTGFGCFFGNPAVTDLWYRFTAAADREYELELAATTVPPGVEVFTGDCGAPVRLDCSNGSDRLRIAAAPQPRTLYLRIFRGQLQDITDFTLCLRELTPPANDELSGAIELRQEVFYRPDTFTVAGATESLPGEDCDGQPARSPVPDVWFSFVANTARATIRAELDDGQVPRIEVFDPSFNFLLDCLDPDFGDDRLALSQLTPGQRYYFRVYDSFGFARGPQDGELRVSVYGVPVPSPLVLPDGICAQGASETSVGDGRWRFVTRDGQLLAAVLDRDPMGRTDATIHGYSGPALRTDQLGTPYADRSVNVSVIQQPSSGPTEVVLFLPPAELSALVAASPDVQSIADVVATKFGPGNCRSGLPAATGELLRPRALGRLPNGDHALLFRVDAFSSFYFHGGPVPLDAGLALPVSCTEFTVRRGGDNLLAWTTDYEADHAAWRIERSPHGRHWTALATQPAAAPKLFRDRDGVAGDYYRLVAVALDGSEAQACGTVRAPGAPTPAATRLRAYPNPARAGHGMTLSGNFRSPTTVSLLDAHGRVHSVFGLPSDGPAELTLPTGLPPGVYFLRTNGAGGATATVRVLIH